MSRIHSGRKGRSGSTRPYPLAKPTWVSLDADEITEEAVKLAKTGLNSAQVGTTLRDTYGVPSVRAVTGRRLSTLLAEKGIKQDLPEDLQALLKRVVHLQRHLTQHPHDTSNQRGLSLMESRIRRLAHYYRRRKVLPENWSYTAASAVLQVE
ncbi:MAG TPA: 30S ribosomal protein S15 [Thermoplasmata archaeon]|nr:30S ribosomal protein S15 [Thermoplasmata archaeon]